MFYSKENSAVGDHGRIFSRQVAEGTSGESFEQKLFLNKIYDSMQFFMLILNTTFIVLYNCVLVKKTTDSI